ncbi:alpha/beta fold hydrolase [Haladaptatus sp. GCM10025707]|nr:MULTISPECIES: alpha/beta hydrolase [unclassified Haladaptatus]
MADIASVLDAGLADVQVEVMEGTAHVPPLEKPEEFNALLRSFLKRFSL